MNIELNFSKREYFAFEIYKQLLKVGSGTYKERACIAVECVDEFIAKLATP